MNGWGFDLGARDLTVNPGDDFYRHANGGALDRLAMTDDQTSYGSVARVDLLVREQVRQIILDLASPPHTSAGSNQQKIGDAYRAFMDEARIEALDGRPLAPLMEKIRAADTHEKMAVYMGETEGSAGASLFGFEIGPDPMGADKHAIALFHAGLGLPSAEYYSQPQWAEKKALYQAYVTRMLEMAGWTDPAQTATRVLDFEDKIAAAHWTPEQGRSRDATFNAYTIDRLANEAPHFPWRSYFDALGTGEPPRLIVIQNTAMPAIAKIFAETPIATLQAWQAFRTADEAAPQLASRFANARWEFRSRDLAGQTRQRRREDRGVGVVETMLGDALGREYLSRHFSPKTQSQMAAMTANLRDAFEERLRRNDWMGPDTKRAAQEKLSRLTFRIGGPEARQDYSRLEIRADDAFGNAERAGRLQWAQKVARLNERPDRSGWQATAQTVNAFYSPNDNSITIPAAILQPPFFDPQADPAVNYGAIGAMIGHEIGHAFDDQGSKFDAEGVFREWWTSEDRATFVSLAARLGEQYGRYEALPGLTVRPGLTMGENIGDAAGVAVALDAYHLSLHQGTARVIDGVTGDQRFFYGWAQVWRAREREDLIRQHVATDGHSPPAFRVIGPLRNLDAWYDAFDVQPGAKYYLAPEDRVRIW